MKALNSSTARPPERTLVLHIALHQPGVDKAAASSLRPLEWRLQEACALADAIELNVLAAYTCVIKKPHPGTLLGKGWVDKVRQEIDAHTIQLLFVDGKLSPIQQRNLERVLNCKVIDRTALILEIFGRRAQTSEGRLQVEMASLQYQKSRLVRSWTHLERQRGGFGFMGGPGESQLELDKRMLGTHIQAIRQELSHVERTRTLQRQARKRVPFPVVALVGYTNAGKSTLFNRLTNADVKVADLLFATLDPTLRQIPLLGGKKVLLSDTVGFISDLPTTLVAAFRATLEEVAEADLLLHVIDASHPEWQNQRQDVEKVLAEIGLREDQPLLEVWNKTDRLGLEDRQALVHHVVPMSQALVSQAPLPGDSGSLYPPVLISATAGDGIDTLLARIGQICDRFNMTYRVTGEPWDGKLWAWLHSHGTVVGHAQTDDLYSLDVILSPQNTARLSTLFPQVRVEELTDFS